MRQSPHISPHRGQRAETARRCNLLRYFNSRGGTRTPDPLINSQLLYRLSYSGMLRRADHSRRVKVVIPALSKQES
jgi:hypothetical protein